MTVVKLNINGNKIAKEVADNTVSIRRLGSEKQETMKREDLIKDMLKANKLPLN